MGTSCCLLPILSMAIKSRFKFWILSRPFYASYLYMRHLSSDGCCSMGTGLFALYSSCLVGKRNHLETQNLTSRFTSSSRDFCRTLGLALLIGVPCMAVSIGVDRWVFGRWTVNQINFLRFNFFSSGADFYGVQPWHWYLSIGLPSVLALHLPLVLIGWCVDFSRGCSLVKRKGSKPRFQDIKESTIAMYFGLWILWTVFAYR